MTDANRHILALSVKIVAAHTGHNSVESDALPRMIRNVYNTLADLSPGADGFPTFDVEAEQSHAGHYHLHAGSMPAHPPHHGLQNLYTHPTHGQTVFDDHLICMEDGLSMKMLKRHLLTVHGMTPDEYRSKWGLPPDYPMVAAEYAKLRSSLALQSGLGLKPEDRPSRKRKSRRG
jgi:predicted transcriptional regulator